MALHPEAELGVLPSQCLDRRIADKQTLIEEIGAWVDDRNATVGVAGCDDNGPREVADGDMVGPSTYEPNIMSYLD
jgi:hypothetical protein